MFCQVTFDNPLAWIQRSAEAPENSVWESVGYGADRDVPGLLIRAVGTIPRAAYFIASWHPGRVGGMAVVFFHSDFEPICVDIQIDSITDPKPECRHK